MPIKQFFLLLFVIVTTNCFSQKIKGTVLSFKYKGQSFQIYSGTKIGLGKGLNADGTFECASREKLLRQRETYQSTNSSYQSNKSTTVSTGEKEYLPKQYSLGMVTVLKVTYLKKLDEYRIVLGTAEGNYNFYLQHGVKNGEVVAINGNKLPETVPAAVTGNTTTTYETGAMYAVQLKNGSRVNGVLREASSNSFKIETSDKNLFVFTTAEIADIKKVNADNTSPVSDANTNEFEILQSPYGTGLDTTPLGCFANYTDLSFLLVNKVEKSYSGKYGFSINNTSGYLFKNIFFLGGGIGYTGCMSDSIKYHLLSFGLNERVYLLGKRKISPYVSLHEKIATTLKSISTSSGVVLQLGGDVGVDFKIGKKFSISPYVGYTYHVINKAPIISYQSRTGVRPAHYFVFGVSLGLRNL